jgi:hypothetical protein
VTLSSMQHSSSNNRIKLEMILIGIFTFIAGFLFAFLVRFMVVNRRIKKGMLEIKYNKLPISSKLKLMVREVVFRFSIQRFNRDFLVNLKSNDIHLIQILHRSHFPEVCKNVSDVKFGLAVYIPTRPLSHDQKKKLQRILKEEMENYEQTKYPVEYHVIDAGSRPRFTGYLLARMVREVFQKDDVDIQIFDEGILPYHYPAEIIQQLAGH